MNPISKGWRKLCLILLALLILASTLVLTAPTRAYATWPIPVPGGIYATHGHGNRAVMVLHSLSFDWRQPAAQWNQAAERYGFLAIYPDTPSHSWNAGLCCGVARDRGEDSGAFLARVVADAKARYRFRYLYVAGTSNGGMEALRLVAERPWITGRVATWGAAPEMPFPGNWTGRVYYADGAGDTTVPWRGGYATWCPCEIRSAQSLSFWLPRASRLGRLYAGYGHAAPNWFPAEAWKFFTK